MEVKFTVILWQSIILANYCSLTISTGILQMEVLLKRLLLLVLNTGQKLGVLKNIFVKISKVFCRCLLCQPHDVGNGNDLLVFIWLCHRYNDLTNLWTGQLTGKNKQIGKSKGVLELLAFFFFFLNLWSFVLICCFLACWKHACEVRLKPCLPWEVEEDIILRSFLLPCIYLTFDPLSRQKGKGMGEKNYGFKD